MAEVAVDAEAQEPTPAEHADVFAVRFRSNANSLAMAYGGPLFLVGSMLTSLEPGDIDLRLVLTHEDGVEMFGKDCHAYAIEWSAGRWRVEREQLKQSRRQTRRWKGGAHPSHVRRFDFQFVFATPISMFEIGDRPRLRLDTVPASYFDAGRGDP